MSNFSHSPATYKCPFCSLFESIHNDQPHNLYPDIVFHNNVVAAVISAHQYSNNLGNTLVIPITHIENIYTLPLELATDIVKLTKAVVLSIKQIWDCDGISIRQNNESAGGQDVWHYHVHVTPRYENDDFLSSNRELVSEQQRAEMAYELRFTLEEIWRNT
ncbi:MAG: HIT family protein [Chloroflexi bacterium]|nr:HIT family protein [Chloroflexota bacterium]